MTRVPGIGQVQIFGAGQYAIRLWVNPDTLAKLDITVERDRERAAGPEHRQPGRPGRRRAGAAGPGVHLHGAARRGAWRASTDFENVVVRAKPDGSLVRVKDVARVELGAQSYIRRGPPERAARPPSSLIYQLPGSNAIDTMKAATKLMEEAKARFPSDLDYVTALDTTLAVSAGHPRDRQDPGRGHSSWSSSSSSSSCRASGRRSFRCWRCRWRSSARSWSFRCWASRSTRCRSSASCWPSASWWTTPSSSSRRSSTTSRRAVAARRRLQGDGGGVGTGRGDRADPGRRVHPDGLHPGHHRADVPAVRGDDRRVGAHLGLQRAHAEPGALGAAPAAAAGDARPAGRRSSAASTAGSPARPTATWAPAGI